MTPNAGSGPGDVPGPAPSPGGADGGSAPPLAGLRVVDLCDLRGAMAGRVLADLGADVVLVEPPGGSTDRLRAPFVDAVPGPDHSIAFLFRQAGKRGATLDLRTPTGASDLDRLLDRADVLVENLAPGERSHLGIDPDAIAERHPRLIHVAIADFGLDGPRRDWRLEALPAFAASGALHASGFADRPPCWIPGHLAHDAAALTAAAGAIAALLDRDADGRGRTIEVSVQEAALCGLHPWSIPVADVARLYPLLPVDLPRDADGAYLVLPTADGHVRVLPATPAQFAAFLQLLRGPTRGTAADDGAGDPAGGAGGDGSRTRADDGLLVRTRRSLDALGAAIGSSVLAATPAPVARRLAELPREAARRAAAALAAASRLAPLPAATAVAMQAGLALARRFAGEALRRRRRADVLREAAHLRVPMAPVQTPDEYRDSAQARARRAFVATGFPGLGDAPVARTPLRMDGVSEAPLRPAPRAPGGTSCGQDAGPVGSGMPPGGPDAAPSREVLDAAVDAWSETRDEDGPARRARDPRPGPPLSGLRVIDLGVGAAVPEIGWLLAELGADVIRLESPLHLDFLRRITVEPDTPNRSWMFNDANRGQRSVCIDLSCARGRELALAICATADVVIENHRGGVASELGLDEPAVRARRPDVIWLSSQGYGRGGPLDRAPAFGPLVSAFAGITWLANHPDARYPAGSSLNHPDHVASKLGLLAVLAALLRRRRGGAGATVEMAQTEVAAWLAGEIYLQGPLGAGPATPAGNAAAFACPHGVFPAAGRDRWCAIAVVGEAAWQALRRALGWSLDPSLESLAGRLARRGSVEARLAEWTRMRSPEEAAALLQSAGVSAMPVLSALDLRADPHLAHRHALVSIDEPELGRVLHCANPIRASRPLGRAAGAAPRLGADTDAVLREVLGLDDASLRRLRREGVCF